MVELPIGYTTWAYVEESDAGNRLFSFCTWRQEWTLIWARGQAPNFPCTSHCQGSSIPESTILSFSAELELHRTNLWSCSGNYFPRASTTHCFRMFWTSWNLCKVWHPSLVAHFAFAFHGVAETCSFAGSKNSAKRGKVASCQWEHLRFNFSFFVHHQQSKYGHLTFWFENLCSLRQRLLTWWLDGWLHGQASNFYLPAALVPTGFSDIHSNEWMFPGIQTVLSFISVLPLQWISYFFAFQRTFNDFLKSLHTAWLCGRASRYWAALCSLKPSLLTACSKLPAVDEDFLSMTRAGIMTFMGSPWSCKVSCEGYSQEVAPFVPLDFYDTPNCSFLKEAASVYFLKGTAWRSPKLVRWDDVGWWCRWVQNTSSFSSKMDRCFASGGGFEGPGWKFTRDEVGISAFLVFFDHGKWLQMAAQICQVWSIGFGAIAAGNYDRFLTFWRIPYGFCLSALNFNFLRISLVLFSLSFLSLLLSSPCRLQMDIILICFMIVTNDDEEYRISASLMASTILKHQRSHPCFPFHAKATSLMIWSVMADGRFKCTRSGSWTVSSTRMSRLGSQVISISIAISRGDRENEGSDAMCLGTNHLQRFLTTMPSA